MNFNIKQGHTHLRNGKERVQVVFIKQNILTFTAVFTPKHQNDLVLIKK